MTLLTFLISINETVWVLGWGISILNLINTQPTDEWVAIIKIYEMTFWGDSLTVTTQPFLTSMNAL